MQSRDVSPSPSEDVGGGGGEGSPPRTPSESSGTEGGAGGGDIRVQAWIARFEALEHAMDRSTRHANLLDDKVNELETHSDDQQKQIDALKQMNSDLEFKNQHLAEMIATLAIDAARNAGDHQTAQNDFR